MTIFHRLWKGLLARLKPAPAPAPPPEPPKQQNPDFFPVQVTCRAPSRAPNPEARQTTSGQLYAPDGQPSGLVYHPPVQWPWHEEQVLRHPDEIWGITHAKSGVTVGYVQGPEDRVREAVRAMAKKGNWNLSVEELQESESLWRTTMQWCWRFAANEPMDPIQPEWVEPQAREHCPVCDSTNVGEPITGIQACLNCSHEWEVFAPAEVGTPKVSRS